MRLLAALVSFLSAALALPGAELTTLSGAKQNGTLVKVERQELEFRDSTGKSEKIAIKDVALVDYQQSLVQPSSGTEYHEVELTDGSLIRVSQLRIKGKKVEITTLPVKAEVSVTYDIPLSALFWFHRSAHNPANVDQWRRLVGSRGKRDLFVVREGQKLNTTRGTVVEGDAEGGKIQFIDESGATNTLRLSGATGGLIFNQVRTEEIAPKLCSVSDIAGNQFTVKAIEPNGDGFKLTTVSGAVITYPNSAFLVKIDFAQGNIAYLSDMNPDVAAAPQEEESPLGKEFNVTQRIRGDKALDGSELTTGGKYYTKGIAVPPDMTLTYKIDGYREFKTVIGVPDTVRAEGNMIRVRIEIDGQEVWTEAFGRKSPPREIVLAVKDSRTLKIITERESPIAVSQIFFAEARLQK